MFLSPATVRFHDGPRAGDWHNVNLAYPPHPESRDVFDAWIDHGTSLKDAAYAYAVYPTTDEKTLTAAAAASPVTVSRNTPDCQAVWHAGLNRGGAVFYAPGSVELHTGLTLTVDQPCMALLTTDGGKTRVTISNPENKSGTVKVTVTDVGKASTLDVQLPDGGHAGDSVTAAF